MTSILGISCFYHDSAAALIKDGKIIAAAQEERFTRKKNDSNYPFNSVEFVLNFSNLKLDQVDHIVFYEKPFLKFERLLETYVAFAPRGFQSFCKSMPVWIGEKLFQKKLIIKKLKSHDVNFKNETTDYANNLSFNNLGETMNNTRYGMKHNINASSSIKVFKKTITINPLYQFSSLWYMNEIQKTWNNNTSEVITDTINNFVMTGSHNISASATSKIYGFYHQQ